MGLFRWACGSRFSHRLCLRGLAALVPAVFVLLWGAPGASAANRIYWGDGLGHNATNGRKVSFANLNGTGHGGDLNTTGVTPEGPEGLGMDLLNGKIYWADGLSDTISFANLDNTGGAGHLNTMGATEPSNPSGVATDPANGRIY
jgi:hypothetical protein